MRIVLDTNVLARAVRGKKGPAGEVLRRVFAPPHLLIVSPSLLSELSRILRYRRVRALHGLDEEGMDTFVRSIRSAALLVNTALRPPRIVPDDPDDDVIIAAAIAGNADVLCTLDRHFRHSRVLSFCRQQGIDVLSDVELLAVLRQTAA